MQSEADAKAAACLAVDLQTSGKSLHRLLEKQEEYQRTRVEALRSLEADGGKSIESTLKEMLSSSQTEVRELEEQVSALQREETDLAAKIVKRKADFERNEERLAELSNIRPAYMDEYEILERELKGLQLTHDNQVRNLQYLEHELSKVERRERQKAKRAECNRLKVQRSIEAEEEALLLLHQDDSTANSTDSGSSEEPASALAAAPASASGRSPIDVQDGSSGGTTSTSISSEEAPLSGDGSSLGSSDSDDSAW